MIRAPAIIFILFLLVGCAQQSVQPFPGDGDMQPGITYFFPKDRLETNNAPVLRAPLLAYHKTYLSEPGTSPDKDIILVNLETGETRQVTDAPTMEESPRLSEDYLLWTERKDGKFILHAEELSTGERFVVHTMDVPFRNLEATQHYALWEEDRPELQPAIMIADLRDSAPARELHPGFPLYPELREGDVFRTQFSVNEGSVVMLEQQDWDDPTSTRFNQIWLLDIESGERTALFEELPAHAMYPVQVGTAVYFFARKAPDELDYDVFRVQNGTVSPLIATSLHETRFDASAEGVAGLREDPSNSHSTEIIFVDGDGEAIVDDEPVSVHVIETEDRLVVWQTWGGPDGSQVFVQRVP